MIAEISRLLAEVNGRHEHFMTLTSMSRFDKDLPFSAVLVLLCRFSSQYLNIFATFTFMCIEFDSSCLVQTN
jgi:hypothetical protein